MKTSTRVICICVAALMLLSVFGMLFSQLALAAEISNTSSNSDSSSNSDDDSDSDDESNNYTGTLRIQYGPDFYRADSDGSVDSDARVEKIIRKGPLYLVQMTVVDSTVFTDDVSKINVSGTPYVSSTGGNFSTVMKADEDFNEVRMDVLGLVGGSPKLYLEFYVRADGKGKKMDMELGYTYIDSSGNNERQAKSNFSMRINGAVLDDDANDESEDEYLIASPNIIITAYNYGTEDIQAGFDFPLTLKFTNTSKSLNLENIVMDITTSADLYIADGSNSTFIQNMGKGETQSKTMMITAAGSIEPKPQQITVKFTYDYVLNKKRIEGKQRTEVLAVPIVQLDRFSVDEMSYPTEIYPGDSAYISVNYVNKGKTEVPNLSARLESDTPGIADSQNVGNVKAGDSGSIDFQFTVNTPGPITGKVVITYEDMRGKEKSIERPFSANVMDMGGMMGNEEPEIPMEPEPTGLTTATKVMAVIGGVMVAGLTGTVVVKKVKAKREEENDEDI